MEAELTVKTKFAASPIPEDATIRGVRALFSQAGTDPTKDRPSGEALIRRIMAGKGLYRINAAVDVNNIVSILSGCPCGLYDLDRIEGDTITVFVGAPGTIYEGISGKSVNGESRIITSDSRSVFGGPVADSKRTCVTSETKNLLMLIYFPTTAPKEKLDKAMTTAIALMSHCCGATATASGKSSF
ncbi:MAG: phenylalanine--tRNA ligase beta subunit-related protein [Candidatus ainarchaeum sp.]|nr:phenylalanine--tRNA ligase beta subunit-related protein [Candidatus ainarchaeum sp.]